MKNKSQASMQALWDSSNLSGNNAAYLEQIYEDYLHDPSSVEPEWQSYFSNLPKVNGTESDISHEQIRAAFRDFVSQKHHAGSAPLESLHQAKQIRVLQLINSYRFIGHLHAHINPLEPIPEKLVALPREELTEADLDTHFNTGSLVGPESASLRQILKTLKKSYCGTIGAEYMHIPDAGEKRWIQERLEGSMATPNFSAEKKKQILQHLTSAEGMERYLHTTYLGQKRFSLEGAESLVPMLDEMIQHGGQLGVKEVCIAMAHRGRLNMLINVMGKRPGDLFSEFEGTVQRKGEGSGDVKYHQGFSSNIDTSAGPVHVNLAFNPSHLEIVGPVVEGSVRARQDRRGDRTGDEVVPVVIHGDAAFAGQGVVMETLNMSQSRGYATKGTLHIIVNNQIGFTTSNQRDARSTYYCTDVAKMVNAPIFHVNGDDPEAVVFITQLAMEYRMTFKKDVILDMVCYRRHGHNEADEPWATQPTMYKQIQSMPTTCRAYGEKLVAEGVLAKGEPAQLETNYRDMLDVGDSVVSKLTPANEYEYPYDREWERYMEKSCLIDADTQVPEKLLRELSDQLAVVPEGFKLHGAIKKVVDARLKMGRGEQDIDWGFAETMAYATLAHEKFNVRLSGQDCGRGTFFHRHAVHHDQNNGDVYVPLRNISDGQGNFLVINSLLSEEAVLAFEYGYSSTDPNTLVIWEAQFGDFANGAQVVIDQFISAGEQKWERLSGLVMLLPHGYEGQGPEHSSARLERYLQLCAEQNMQVCMPTTAAQIFHLLRRQMLLTCRKPLIIMTPKSLLRHKLAASSLSELTTGKFHNVIADCGGAYPKKVKRIVICSGKVYYDLVQRREAEKRDDVAVIRLEQLYPFPAKELSEAIEPFDNASSFVWCQEEPKNQGAWFTSQHHIRSVVKERAYLEYAGRPFSAAPAVGYMSLHKEQLKSLLDDAFAIPEQN